MGLVEKEVVCLRETAGEVRERRWVLGLALKDVFMEACWTCKDTVGVVFFTASCVQTESTVNIEFHNLASV